MPRTAGGVDVVVDNVGAATWGNSLRCLAKGGRLLTVGADDRLRGGHAGRLMFGKHLSIIGSTMGTQADFEAVMAQVWAGTIQPVVDQVFPLAEYPAALARMMAGEGFGKILVQVRDLMQNRVRFAAANPWHKGGFRQLSGATPGLMHG